VRCTVIAQPLPRFLRDQRRAAARVFYSVAAGILGAQTIEEPRGLQSLYLPPGNDRTCPELVLPWRLVPFSKRFIYGSPLAVLMRSDV